MTRALAAGRPRASSRLGRRRSQDSEAAANLPAVDAVRPEVRACKTRSGTKRTLTPGVGGEGV